MPEPYTHLQMEAALCVWECINDWTLSDSPRDDWKALRDNVGSVELRHWSIELGTWCLAVYDACTKHDSDFFDGIAYDWEVIPMILDMIAIPDGAQTTAGIVLPDVTQTASLVARRHTFNEFELSCRHESDRQWKYADFMRDHPERVENAFEDGEEPAEFVKWLGEKYELYHFD